MLSAKTKKDFPIFVHNEKLVYLDNAATTQKPLSVIESMNHYYTHFNANIGRGIYSISMRSHQAFEESREVIRQFVNAPASKNIVFTKGTTEAVNFVARAFARKRLDAGDEVIVTGMEHHSNLLPWQVICQEAGAKLRIVPVDKEGKISLDDFREMLNSKTKMVAAAHVSNVLGVTNPVKDIIAMAHAKGVPVMLDGAQAIAHTKVNVQDLDVDFYCFSSHKMYGPMGVGVLYVKEEHLKDLEAFQTGGGVAFGVNYQEVTDFMPAPYKFEAGTPNVAGAIGVAEAAKYISAVGYDAIRKHEEEMCSHAIERLVKIPGVEIFGSKKEPTNIISFSIKNIHPYDVGNHLNKFDIAVRTGVHCAIPLVDSLGVLGTVRMSFAMYNSVSDIDTVSEALQTVAPSEWTHQRPNSRFMF